MFSQQLQLLQTVALLQAYAVREIVLCPSPALLPWLQAFSAERSFHLHRVTDPRSAGFYAVGLSSFRRQPVAVIVSTAQELWQLQPAVLAAHEQHLPVVVLSVTVSDHLSQVGSIADSTGLTANVFGALVKEHAALRVLSAVTAPPQVLPPVAPAQAPRQRFGQSRSAVAALMAAEPEMAPAVTASTAASAAPAGTEADLRTEEALEDNLRLNSALLALLQPECGPVHISMVQSATLTLGAEVTLPEVRVIKRLQPPTLWRTQGLESCTMVWSESTLEAAPEAAEDAAANDNADTAAPATTTQGTADAEAAGAAAEETRAAADTAASATTTTNTTQSQSAAPVQGELVLKTTSTATALWELFHNQSRVLLILGQDQQAQWQQLPVQTWQLLLQHAVVVADNISNVSSGVLGAKEWPLCCKLHTVTQIEALLKQQGLQALEFPPALDAKSSEVRDLIKQTPLPLHVTVSKTTPSLELGHWQRVQRTADDYYIALQIANVQRGRKQPIDVFYAGLLEEQWLPKPKTTVKTKAKGKAQVEAEPPADVSSSESDSAERESPAMQEESATTAPHPEVKPAFAGHDAVATPTAGKTADQITADDNARAMYVWRSFLTENRSALQHSKLSQSSAGALGAAHAAGAAGTATQRQRQQMDTSTTMRVPRPVGLARPDVVVTIGGNSLSPRLTHFIKAQRITHYHVSPTGELADFFGTLSTVIAMEGNDFLSLIARVLPQRLVPLVATQSSTEPDEGYAQLQARGFALPLESEGDLSMQPVPPIETLATPEQVDAVQFSLALQRAVLRLEQERESFPVAKWPYSQMQALGWCLEMVPDKSVVHFASHSLLRYSQMLPRRSQVLYQSLTIQDNMAGALSSALGFASLSRRLNFIVVSDVSFFADMNALWPQVGANVRILLLNNHGGELAELDAARAAALIAAEPTGENQCGGTDIRQRLQSLASTQYNRNHNWATAQGFQYLQAQDSDELKRAMRRLCSTERPARDSKKPMLLEVLTTAAADFAALELLSAHGYV